jgi:hypothetical protein
MPRRALALTALLAAAAVVLLAALSLTERRSQAFTLGVVNGPFVELAPGHEICQAPIAVPQHGDFDGVTFSVGTGGQGAGPALAVSVRDASGDAVLARGTLPGGYPDVDRVPSHTVWTSRVRGGRFVSVCLANRGRRTVYVFGNADASSRSTQASLDGAPAAFDVNLSFERREPRTLAALVPAMFERAALFRGQLVGTWTYVLLAVLVLLAVPALLIRAMARVSDGAQRGEDETPVDA